MPQMEPLTKVVMIALIGLMVAGIVVYHLWIDRRLAREAARQPAPEAGRPAPAAPAPAASRARERAGA